MYRNSQFHWHSDLVLTCLNFIFKLIKLYCLILLVNRWFNSFDYHFIWFVSFGEKFKAIYVVHKCPGCVFMDNFHVHGAHLQLYELMMMAFKYQVALCPRPRDLLLITFNHMDGVRELVKDNPSLVNNINEIQRLITEVSPLRYISHSRRFHIFC